MTKKRKPKKAAQPKSKGKRSGKKKKGAGRSKPKKQQSKKQKAKKKLSRNKGLGLYIRVKSQIWRKHKGDFPSSDYRKKGSKFLTIVGQIYGECKSSGKDCPNYIILEKYAQIQSEQPRPEPFIPLDLYEETHPYWEIKDVEFQLFAPYLWVVSPMLIASPSEFEVSQYVDSDGDTTRGYNIYFKEWVDWCNMVYREKHGADFGSEVVEIHFIFSKPKWNDAKKRWETEILSVTPSGEIDDFGFEPTGTGTPHDPSEHEPHKTTKEEGKAAPKATPPSKGVEEVQKEEIRRTAKLERLIKTKQSIMDEIRMWADVGDKKEQAAATKRLKAINKQIEQATR